MWVLKEWSYYIKSTLCQPISYKFTFVVFYLPRVCCISVEAMPNMDFKHFCALGVPWKLYRWAHFPCTFMGNPWVTLGNTSAQNEDKCLIPSDLLLFTCYLLLIQPTLPT